jgi:hypothetical protein
MREAWCSVPAKSGAHLVNKGKTAVQRYRLRAKAMSVALRAACKGIRGYTAVCVGRRQLSKDSTH